MRSPEIRERFLHYFEGRGHQRLPSASLVAYDDPTVLFTVAGMVPLQPYFRGARTPPAPRVASCQKCLRTVDIEEVGDASHNTFFEMLGNFSFGDYFKEGAITLAWEFLTADIGLPGDRLWPSIHPGDADALDVWVSTVGVPRERISLLEDNFWGPAGPSGPCGFDSEIYWDWGSPCSCGRAHCSPDTQCGGDRWTEVWNLVFPEFDQDETGGRTPLPKPGIDTGMGLERFTAVLQGVRSIYDTDLFAPIVAGFRSRADQAEEMAERHRSFNVLADHLRASAFLIADGVAPSNEARGYVLRRVIRRAALHGRRLQLHGGLAAGVDDLVQIMGGAYPELAEHRALIEATLGAEEEAFEHTLAEGMERLESLLASSSAIAGRDAFRLHDTYGFPVELTVELARERDATVDLAGFAEAMGQQRQRSRSGAERGAFDAGHPDLPPTTFVGYDTLECDARVLYTGGGVHNVVIEPSPFYAEAGGQVGDRGELTWEDGRVDVADSQFFPGTEIRALTLVQGADAMHPGMKVHARVDADRRARTARHHSATHLLHKSLKLVLGDEVVQRGSLVEPAHTTFDFNFSRALTADEVFGIEATVNEAIRRNLERTATVMPIAQARESGAVALFGEKYGDNVRVVDFGGWSRELCGGTHVERTGDIGAAIILSESSIGAGTRRIDMVAGDAAESYWRDASSALRETARTLRARPEEVADRVVAMLGQIKRLQRELEEAQRRALSGSGVRGAEVEDVAGYHFGHLLLDGSSDARAVDAAVDGLFAERLGGSGVALVLGDTALAMKVGGDALAGGVRAGDLVAIASQATGGRGGGRPDFARGGVGDASRRDAAVAAVREAIGRAGSDAA
ncbi:MAG TPA: alanine--tRNA ligase [Candidatus Dormibacteraeota bacterium]|nr:alanine--tRNA ligase [Candidatus Dormibacteraeota bacterium]